jgi:predicted RNA binding protein with dsRBD fold (UPF0201 family)
MSNVNDTKYRVTSRLYEFSRKNFSQNMKGHPNFLKSQNKEARKKIGKASKNRFKNMSVEERAEYAKKSFSKPESWTEERKKKISKKLIGKPKSDQARLNMSKAAQTKNMSHLFQQAEIKKGSFWANNGKIEAMVHNLDIGWSKGRLKRKKYDS